MKFTAEMEQTLDDIAEGDVDWLDYLHRFYLGEQGLEGQVKEKESAIDPRRAGQVDFPDLPVEVRIGQFGPFLAKEINGDRRTFGLPDNLPPADLDAAAVEALVDAKQAGPDILGADPASGQPVLLKDGPYGAYVQLGEDHANGKGKKKPKRASLIDGMTKEGMDLPTALQLLSLPRVLGAHPDDGEEVRAGVGRYGPYVVHNGKFVSLKPPDNVLKVDLPRALALIKAAPERKRGGSTRTVLKELGAHPDDGDPIRVLDGRYGPYVNHKRTNATVPKDADPQRVTLEQALQMLAERQGRSKGRGSRRKKK